MVAYGCSTSEGSFSVHNLGKNYRTNHEKLVPGMYHHIEKKDDVVGGNTSIRNVNAENLVWKGNPNENGYGYFQRNRDLGQVFTVGGTEDVILDALVLRTSRGNNAVMKGAIGAKMNIVFFEVKRSGKGLSINENGTTKGDSATHGFDHQFNRADDYIEGATYTFLHHSIGGSFPDIGTTSQFVYDNGKGEPFGEQEGHLIFFRCDFSERSEIVLKAGKTYAFLIGFTEAASSRGLALAISSEVHTKEKGDFLRDSSGNIRWGVRREGNGDNPPMMLGNSEPPENKKLKKALLGQSLFPKNHFKGLEPTSDGYPDVDTYRTLQFYLEVK